MLKRIHVRQHQLALLFRRGDFVRVLEPGDHWLPGLWTGRDRVELVNKLAFGFQHELLDLLVREPDLAERLEVLDLRDDQRALVWRDGRLAELVGPGLHAFWKQPRAVKVEVFDVTVARFEHASMDVIQGLSGSSEWLRIIEVEPQEVALFYVDGALTLTAGAGRYAFWKGAGSLTWRSVDLREQVLDVGGQEIMTADKVTLRLNLFVSYVVRDPELALTAVENAGQALYRAAQLALRAAVGTRKLDALLADKEAIGVELAEALALRASAVGLGVLEVGLRDVILPGEMKTILNQVIEAQKRAEANLIQRREETAAARSQANTAKLLAENPALARMKELEALQAILAGSRATFVLGQGDALGQLRELTGPQSAD